MGMIRLLLAVAVFNSHFGFLDVPIVDGHEAVLTFFAISGFYMALVLDTAYTSSRSFYLSRFLTLYPAYVLTLGLSIGLVVSMDIHPMTSKAELSMLLSDPIAALTMLTTSITLVGQELLFCLAPTHGGGLEIVTQSRNAIWHHAPLIQAWSLSLEIMFYALAPFLVMLRSRTLCGLIGASIALKGMVLIGGGGDIVFFKRFFLTEFWLFGSGILSYRFYKTLPPTARGTDLVSFAILLSAVLTADLVLDELEPFALPAVAITAMPFIFRWFRRFDFDRLLGKISYPFYLLHYSFIAIFEAYQDEPSGWAILLVTLATAFLVHLFFTPGIERLKGGISRNIGRLAMVNGDIIHTR